jgi:hypothetical protein
MAQTTVKRVRLTLSHQGVNSDLVLSSGDETGSLTPAMTDSESSEESDHSSVVLQALSSDANKESNGIGKRKRRGRPPKTVTGSLLSSIF